MRITERWKKLVDRAATLWKAIVAAVGGLATALAPIVADDIIGWDEAGAVVSAFVAAGLTVAGVWRVPNRAPGGQRTALTGDVAQPQQ